MFSKPEEDLIHSKGITIEQVEDQLKKFREGIPPIELYEPATIGNGVQTYSDQDLDFFLKKYDEYTGSVSKFVPASGAASRMFKHLFEFKDSYDGSDEQYDAFTEKQGPVWEFFKQLETFAFYPQLKEQFDAANSYTLEEALLKREYVNILEFLLTDKGLNYGKLPKGLITFHRYEDGNRIAAHEQLAEGAEYAAKSGKVNIHFTVSPEHQTLFETELAQVRIGSTDLEIAYSVQKPSTDTIAVDEQNQPFKEESGKLLFRPAGHGALLENLNDLKEEVLFVKNIDNVVPDLLKAETIRFKKVIAGVLLDYQQKAFDLLKAHDKGGDVYEEGVKLLKNLGLKGNIGKEEVVQKLNRPIRVCGMVKNEGEPGGGPFWVQEGQTQSLQIVEGAQIDQSEDAQLKILKASTHFNPVDIVCGVYNYKGEKFDLLGFRDLNTGFITGKSSGGRKLKAMELPGLWNGSMSDWNTIFVEVPLITFNPVKTINDLLRDEHC